MNRRHETNPHFVRPAQSQGPDQDQDQDQHPRPTSPWRPRQKGRSHPPSQGQTRKQRPAKQTQPLLPADPQLERSPLAPQHDHPNSQQYQPHGAQAPYPRHPDDQDKLQPPSSPTLHLRGQEGRPRPHGSPTQFPPHHGDHPKPDHQQPHGSPVPSTRHQDLPLWPPRRTQHNGDRRPRREPRHHRGPQMPENAKTKPFTWLTAVFCVIFWVIIILGGLVVLIVYLVFRPRIPRFDVSTASLNAAYLDMGYLLNADLTILANFTNPNKKVSVDFSYMYIELYYGRTLIATEAIEPFSAPKKAAMFSNLHMVTSQVRLSELEIQRLKRHMVNNGVIFDVKGFFRARSNFGGLFRYSYWLHGQCTIMLRRPPDGVLVAKKCKTKHG